MKKLVLLFLLLCFIPAQTEATSPRIKGLDNIKIINPAGLAKVASWKRTPTVVICEHAPVDRKKVREAISWWSERNYMFYHSIYFRGERTTSICQNSDPEGYITINLVTQETFGLDTDMATTHFYVDNETHEIYWAKIYLKKDVQERVLEHEFGHALGWMHTNELSHLMNSKWVRGGWKDTGLKNK